MPLLFVRQDITKMQVDAIVNTTNEKMVGYSGVDLAVHTKAGIELDRECEKLAPLSLGDAKVTNGYNLPARLVIHTRGPIWKDGRNGESILLRSCYTESLRAAVENGCETVAFPLISSGAYRAPKDWSLKFAVNVITEFLLDHELTVYLCIFDRESYEFSKILFGEIEDYLNGDYSIVSQSLNAQYSKRAIDNLIVSESCAPIDYSGAEEQYVEKRESQKSLDDYLRQMDKSFAELLFYFIDESKMSDVECYKRANVDKRTFSKIKSKKDYKPSKETVIAFAISLRLDIEKTEKLLATAGFALSESRKFDKIIRFFIEREIYNIFTINEALFEYDQPLLGGV